MGKWFELGCECRSVGLQSPAGRLTGSRLCAGTAPHLLRTSRPVAPWALATVSKGNQECKMLVSAVVFVPVTGVILFLRF